MHNRDHNSVAIIGMAGRFPGAANLEEFWRNIRDGVESVRSFTDEELSAAGLPLHPQRHEPNYIRARAKLDQREYFDARFFGYTPREAERMDPQQRLFLECAWEAIENGAYDPERYDGAIGVFAGCYLDTYIFANLCTQPDFLRNLVVETQVGGLGPELGNDKDHIATRVAFKLNLKGPAINVQTACSTSLVAICQAVQSLLVHSCDMALAGGAALNFRHADGYLHQEGGMLSSDGHCRAFDHRASGTVFGEGVGVVLLKRLEDAIADRDNIVAVIRGIGLNNDGGAKMSYAAPSADGQAEVIAMAHAFADIEPSTISYLESHGTGTPLGDPIEISALTQAFRAGTDKRQFCALGSLKPNIGHLDVASGVAGLIKTALALQHATVPPLINFEAPNPKIDFAASPFFVPTAARPWNTEGGMVRRAGVSSFGVGGTNAHIVLDEAPASPRRPSTRTAQLITLSAQTPSALEAMSGRLADHLRNYPALDLPDVAYTLQVGRREFNERRVFVARDTAEAVAILESPRNRRLHTKRPLRLALPVVFMFPGQGSQQVGMGAQLYQQVPDFREIVDRCCEILKGLLDFDLRDKVFRANNGAGASSAELKRTIVAQPALFIVEYAMARMLMSWGIQPAAMIGHSVGEFVAGCLAGVFSLEDALLLVATRARLADAMPAGSMLAVRLSEAELKDHLGEGLDVAAHNSPNLTVVAGPAESIAALQEHLQDIGEAVALLETSHAFHSRSMEPVVAGLSETLKSVRFHRPHIPYVSTVTGKWVRDDQANSIEFWAGQVRDRVRFAEGIEVLLSDPANVFLEVGPGTTLATLTRQHPLRTAETPIISCLPKSARGSKNEMETCAEALGHLWLNGCSVDWSRYHSNENRRRIPLPTYPFERQPYWVAPIPLAPSSSCDQTFCCEKPDTIEAEPVNKTPLDVALIPTSTSVPEQLATLFHDLSGIEVPAEAYSTSFLDLGFDSLLLTQVRQSIQTTFKARVSFRTLMEEFNTIDTLAAHLSIQPPPVPQHALSNKDAVSTQILNKAVPAQLLEVMDSPIAAQILRQLDSIQQELTALRFGGPSKQSSAIGDSDRSPNGPTQRPPEETKSHGPFKPLARGRTSGLTEHQKTSLERLITRYTSRTRGSKEYTQTHRRYFCDPRAAGNFRQLWKEMVYPIVAERSKGSRLWDIDGNEYVDVTLGFGVHFLGHSPDFVLAAIQRQLEKGTEIGPQSPLAGEVAKLVSELTGMERVTFCNTGSEAVMAAIRVARTITARNKIVMFSGDYHGMFDSVLVRGFKVGGNWKTAPIAPGIPQSQVDDMVVLDFNSAESLNYIRLHADEIAAVLVEPVQARNPDVQPKEFLHALRRLTKELGIIYIFDEVITGFRCAPGGAQEYFGVRADLATYGKIAGGGIPIGILAGNAEYMDALDGGLWQYDDDSFPEVGVTFFAGTFVRHPLAMAAAHAVLTFLKDKGPSLQAELSARARHLVQDLNATFREFGLPLHLMNFCSLMHYELDPSWEFGGLLFYFLREQGVHIWEGRLGFISIAHTDEDLDLLSNAFRRAAENMAADGFLPERPGGLLPETSLPEGAVSLTAAQKEVWMASQISIEASNAFIESDSLRLKGQPNIQWLEEALETVIQRHDALRCRVSKEGYQFFDAKLRPRIEGRDLRGIPLSEQGTELRKLIEEQVSLAFDLEHGPLLRIQVLRLEDQESILLIVVHHLACDGWSFGVVLRELAELYSAKAEGRAPRLPDPMQFCSFAQRLAAPSEGSHRIEKYWIDRFVSIPPALEFPTDYVRPAFRSWNGQRVSRALNIRDRLARAAKTQNTTPFCFLLAVYQVFLHRLTAAEDLVIGIYDAGQAVGDAHDLVGHCANFLPLRFAISPTHSFEAALKHTKSVLFGAIDHREFTFGQLLEAVKLPRDSSRPPLVNAVFNLDPRIDALTFGDLQCERVGNPRRFYQFDLGFNLAEYSDSLRLDCDFNSNLFQSATIERWVHHFEMLLDAAIESPDVAVGCLPILRPDERKQVLAWGKNAQAEPIFSLPELIKRQVDADPERVAVVSTTGSKLAYRDLWEKSGRIATALRRHDIGHGSVVAICLDRTIDLPATLLAIHRIGACYLPLDPENPQARLAEMLTESSASLVVSDAAFASVLPAGTRSLLISEALHDSVEPFQSIEARLDELAYVIFTSGSTGKPKGVAITHRSLSNFIESMRATPGCSASDRVLAITTMSFDIAALEIFLPLCTGACMVLAPTKTAANADAIIAALTQFEVTIMQATPMTWRSMLALEWKGRNGLKALIGGEALPPDLAESLIPRCGELWNMYGPTETTVWSTIERIRSGGTPISIGRPIANTFAYVANSSNQLQPIGIPGELCLGGLGVAKGYVNSTELTQAKFSRDPFATDEESMIFRTGDLARWLPDGRLECLGRLDRQIKVSGFRIERDEVEGALRRHPSIRDATSVVRIGNDGVPRLIAYYVSKDSTSIETRDLRQHLEGIIPHYMIPSGFVELSLFPLTPSGKIDERALPDLNEVPNVKEPPRNSTELQLIGIWEELLGCSNFGILDDFFELGGHSLLAARMVMTIEKRLGVRIPLQILFESATIAHVAEALLIARKQLVAAEPISVVQATGNKQSIFFFHGDFVGGGFFCHELANSIGPEHPFYAVHPHGMDGQQSPMTIEGMAAERVAQIRAIQPKGPYIVGGYCNGGLTAFEAARILTQQGEDVTGVILLNVDGSNHRFRGLQSISKHVSALLGEREEESVERFLKWSEKVGFAQASLGFYKLSLRAWWKYPMHQRISRGWRKCKRVISRVLGQKVSGSSPVEKAVAARHPISELFHRASSSYVPLPFRGNVAVLWSQSEPAPRGKSPDYGWSSICAKTETRLVPGEHHTSVSERRHLQEVGRTMREVLSDFDPERREGRPHSSRG